MTKVKKIVVSTTAKKEQKALNFGDSTSSIDQLKTIVQRFVEDRNWASYHTPKNLAISISLEASELLEHFQWTHSDPKEFKSSKLREISDEMADVLAYLLSLANILNVDLSKSLKRKMEINKKKYPIDKFNGKWVKVRE